MAKEKPRKRGTPRGQGGRSTSERTRESRVRIQPQTPGPTAPGMD
jgi:hypothetical protein